MASNRAATDKLVILRACLPVHLWIPMKLEIGICKQVHDSSNTFLMASFHAFVLFAMFEHNFYCHICGSIDQLALWVWQYRKPTRKSGLVYWDSFRYNSLTNANAWAWKIKNKAKNTFIHWLRVFQQEYNVQLWLDGKNVELTKRATITPAHNINRMTCARCICLFKIS